MYTFGLIGLGRVTKVLINARIERSSYEHLRRVAEEKGITVSQAVREAIGSHLSRTKKTPDQIRFDILQDDRRRYIGELELEGFRVIDISEIVYDGLEVKPPSLTPENNYIMILDKEEIVAEIGADGHILVENHYVGRLDGFRFTPDASSEDRKSVV